MLYILMANSMEISILGLWIFLCLLCQIVQLSHIHVYYSNKKVFFEIRNKLVHFLLNPLYIHSLSRNFGIFHSLKNMDNLGII